jgi:NAD(P)-dependent dehydrogenase (short-subunit alcohol dehydrogenase family)
MSLVSMLSAKGKNGFGGNTTAEEVTAGLDLTGKNILVTGCNSGLGLESLRVLTMRGANVLGTARDLNKAKAACASVGGKTVPLACELADPTSVRACVAAVHALGLKLDAIICNAGIMALPKRETAFGYELQFFTNHIGHFILVTGLLDVLADDGRVVMLSSDAHRRAPKGGIEFDNLAGERDYTAWKAYGQAKIANLLFAKELAARFAGTKKTANAVHPGVIATNLSRHMPGIARVIFGLIQPIFLKNVGQGAATEVYAAVHPSMAGTTGQYLADCNVVAPRADGSDMATAKRLWEVSEQIVAKLA